ncbi:MAG TPA: alpha-amylase family glycosyl hydrolase [Granulicella sp.]
MRVVRRMMGMVMAAMLGSVVAAAQSAEALHLLKVDPPNWFAGLPKPMLLIRGEGLGGAKFAVSDRSLKIERTYISDNGHWAELWLAASPAHAETVKLTASHGAQYAEMEYTFAARKAAEEGMAGFSSRDVLYLLLPDRFADGDANNDGPDARSNEASAEAAAERAKTRGWHGGDLRGVEEHLDYLQQLGVTALWMTPMYQNHEPEGYHGYHATDMYAVEGHLGTLEDLQHLAKALHRRGMKLVLDTVPNHVGPQHPWVRDEPEPEWFHGTAAHHIAGETHFRSLIDPHAPERDRVSTLEGWFVDALPDMNTENPAVAQYLRQNAVWWIEETGADALRIDTFPYVGRAFWHEFNGELKELYPRLTEVGEVADGSAEIVSSFADGATRAGADTRLYTPLDYPFFHALRHSLRDGAPMTAIADVLAQDALYPHPDRLVPFMDNHDNARFLDGGRSAAALRLAYAIVMTTRGTPHLYYGDELAMSGGEDPENRRDFPGGFAVEHRANSFTSGGRTPEQQAMFAWGAKLGALRKAHEALQCGGEQVLAARADWLVYLRDAAHADVSACGAAPRNAKVSNERVLVAVHRGSGEASLQVPLRKTWMEGCRLGVAELGGASSDASVANDELRLKLVGDDVLVAACQ